MPSSENVTAKHFSQSAQRPFYLFVTFQTLAGQKYLEEEKQVTVT
jgi:hypothetical protein